MSVQVIINVDDPDDIIAGYGAGAKVRLERDTTSAFGSPTEVAVLTLVSGQTQYEYWDSAGTDASWYRSRYSASAGAPFSAYSDGFQPGAPQAYATLDSLREYLKLPNNDQDNLLVDLLRQASDYITNECGRDFYRHPSVSGTEVRLLSSEGGSKTLYVPEGLVSLSALRVKGATNAEFNVLTSADWVYFPTTPELGNPYEGIELTDMAIIDQFYYGFNTVELTGVFGFARVPSLVEKATLDLAREWYRQGPGGGGPVGVNQFGTPMFQAGIPETVRAVKRHYGVRSFLVV